MGGVNVKKNFFDYEWNKGKNLDFDFFHPKMGEMCDRNCPLVFFEIIALFSEDCDYKLKDCYVQMKRLFVRGTHKHNKNELMLRFAGEDNELIIGRVQFIEQRVGKMTKLYEILKKIQKKYKIGKIVIESVITEEMEQWCLKNGFVKKENSTDYIEI